MREILTGLTVATLVLGGCSSSTSETVFGAAPAASPSPAVANPADKIFLGGPIVTMNAAQMEAQAVAVRNGTIVAVGSEATARALQGPSTEVVNLNGRTLMPGFIEPHVHLPLTIQSQLAVPCGSEEPMLPVSEVISRLQAAAAKLPAGQWVVGTNFDPSRSSPLFQDLTANDLDGVSTTVPVFVLNASTHIAYVNHKALEAANITSSRPTRRAARSSRARTGSPPAS